MGEVRSRHFCFMCKMHIVYGCSCFTMQTVQIMMSTLHQLAKHPEVQKKAHDEVVSIAGKDGVITDEVMQKLPYIKAVQKEATR